MFNHISSLVKKTKKKHLNYHKYVMLEFKQKVKIVNIYYNSFIYDNYDNSIVFQPTIIFYYSIFKLAQMKCNIEI